MCTKGPPKCTRKGNVVCWCSIVKSTLCRLTLFGALNVSALCYDPCREVANTEPLTNLQLSRNHFVISYILFRIIPCLSMVPFAMKTCFFPLKFSVHLVSAPQMIADGAIEAVVLIWICKKQFILLYDPVKDQKKHKWGQLLFEVCCSCSQYWRSVIAITTIQHEEGN